MLELLLLLARVDGTLVVVTRDEEPYPLPLEAEQEVVEEEPVGAATPEGTGNGEPEVG